MIKLDTLLEPVAPSEDDSRLALDSSRRLAALLEQDVPPEGNQGTKAPTAHIFIGYCSQYQPPGTPQETLAVPSSALPLLARLLSELGKGHAVALLPVEAELTTQQAAELLNVSRPFVVGLLEQRQIPHRKVGKHRRILLRDVLAFKRRNEADRLATLAELQAQAQELEMGY